MLMREHLELPVSVKEGFEIHDASSLEIAICDFNVDGAQAVAHAINAHDKMAEMLCNHRAYFEGIIEHAPEDTPIEVLDMYRGFVEQIDEVINHG